MNIMYAEIFWLPVVMVMCLVGFFIGRIAGRDEQLSSCADEAIKDNPSKEWRDALIDARARKEKSEVGQ